MSYFKMVEFLVKEVAKANEQIESLTRKAEDDKSVIDRLCKVHDKYFSEAKSAKADLEEMTIEKDHWKEEALEYRDKESNWWKEEKQYKDTIKGLSDELADVGSKIVDVNQHRIRVVGELEDELTLTKKRYQDLIKQNKEVEAINKDVIKGLQLEINHLKNNK